MKIFELRGYLRERGVRGFSMMKKSELEAKVQKLKEQEKAEKYEENLKNTAVCAACLGEQRIQRKIDEKTHDQRLFENTLRILVCDFCQHAKFVVDGDHTVCVDCGAAAEPPTLWAGISKLISFVSRTRLTKAYLPLENVLVFTNEMTYDRDHFTKPVLHLLCFSQFCFATTLITLYHFH